MTHLAKISVIGNQGVGKTSILHRFTNKEFRKNQEATMGVEFFSKTLHYNGTGFKLQFWDASGQERFETCRSPHYLGATLFILVYDINDEASFESLPRWLEEIKWAPLYEDDDNSFFGTEYSQNALVYLVGNKLDLNHLRRVDFEQAQSFADAHGMRYFEMSAKSGDGVRSGFDSMIEHLSKTDLASREAGGPGVTRVLDFTLSSDYEEDAGTQPWIEYEDISSSFSPMRLFCSRCFRGRIF